MLGVGTFLRVTTKTKDDVFGICFYEITDCLDNGSVKCVMVGGTGKAARVGYVVMDTQQKIQQDIAAGVTEVVTKQQALRQTERSNFVDDVARPGAGCIELD